MKFSKKVNIFCIAAQVALILVYFVMCWHAMAIPSDVAITMFFAAFSIEQVCTTFIKTAETKYHGMNQHSEEEK